MSDRHTDLILETLMELKDRVGAIEANVEAVLAQTTKTNGRVTALERWRWLLAGGAAVIVAAWEFLSRK